MRSKQKLEKATKRELVETLASLQAEDKENRNIMKLQKVRIEELQAEVDRLTELSCSHQNVLTETQSRHSEEYTKLEKMIQDLIAKKQG